MIRILLVDDQKSIRERLKSILETEADFDIVGMVDNGYDAIEQVKILKPDVVLMDMEMPDIDGVLATKIISHSSPQTKVLVLSSYDTNEYVAQSLHSGAKGYILKGAPAQEIRDAVRYIERGYMQIAPGLFEKFIPNSPDPIFSKTSSSRAKSIPSNLNLPSGLELTGLNLVKSPTAQPTVVTQDFEQPSELVLDVTALRTNKSLGWYQSVALILAGLGLTGGLYVLRQGLNKPEPTLNLEERVQKLGETPFQGKIEPLQVTKINANVPGFITEVYVKVGQEVKVGDRLLSIRNVDAERVNKEKAIQKQELALQQQRQAMQQAAQRQEQARQQRQILVGQQQAAHQRVQQLEADIANYEQNLAPLRQELAEVNLRASLGTLQMEKVPLRQKEEAVKRAQAIYDRNLATYQRLAKFKDEGAIPQERVEQAEKDLAVAQSDLNLAKADYDSAIVLSRSNSAKKAAQAKQSQLQQELALKEQAGQLRQLEEQLRSARLEEKQIAMRLQQLSKTNEQMTPSNPAATSTTTKTEPVLENIVATTNGTVFELSIAAGDQIFTGNKLIGITNPQKLKVEVEIDPKQSNLLKPGQSAVIKAGEGIESQELIGAIADISPLSSDRNQKVSIEFTNPKSKSLLGQIATVYFPQETKVNN
jgi:DNA-binding NarL/FixJ family response regulator/multidrug resistance efflux pump